MQGRIWLQAAACLVLVLPDSAPIVLTPHIATHRSTQREVAEMRRLDAQIEYYDRLESPLAPTFEARDKTARRGMPAATGGAAAASPGSMLALTDVGRKKSGGVPGAFWKKARDELSLRSGGKPVSESRVLSLARSLLAKLKSHLHAERLSLTPRRRAVVHKLLSLLEQHMKRTEQSAALALAAKGTSDATSGEDGSKSAGETAAMRAFLGGAADDSTTAEGTTKAPTRDPEMPTASPTTLTPLSVAFEKFLGEKVPVPTRAPSTATPTMPPTADPTTTEMPTATPIVGMSTVAGGSGGEATQAPVDEEDEEHKSDIAFITGTGRTAGGRHVGGVDKVPDEGPGWAHQREVAFIADSTYSRPAEDNFIAGDD